MNKSHLYPLLMIVVCLLLILSALAPPGYAAPYQWTDIAGMNYYIDALVYDSGNDILYMGCWNNGVFRCTNPSTSPSWQNIDGGVVTPGAIRSLAYDATNNILYVAQNSVFRCTNPNTFPSWTNMNLIDNISSMAYDSANNILYAGTGMNGQGSGVYRCPSPDTSTTWTSIGGTPGEVEDLLYDQDHNILYCSDYWRDSSSSWASIKRCDSPNGSTSWTNIRSLGAQTVAYTLAYDQTRNILYAGSGGGLRCSDPNTNPVWTELDSPLSWMNTLAYDPTHNTLYAGTQGTYLGVWRCDDPDTNPLWWETRGGISNNSVQALIYCPTINELYAGARSVWRCKIPPAVKYVSSDSGKTGSEITVEGYEFGSTRGTSFVSFGNYNSTEYNLWTDEKIKCKVPQGAFGEADIVVTNNLGTSNEKAFLVTPHLDSVTPNSAFVSETAVIKGSGFGPSRDSSFVTFGDTTAEEYISWSQTEIKCKVPKGINGKPDLSVTTEGGTSNSIKFTVVPNIETVSPNYGPVDTTVEIAGSAFGEARDSANIYIGDIAVTEYVSWADEKIVCRIPNVVAPGVHNLRVHNDQGWSNAVPYTVKLEYYFAEGCTREGFDEWLCIMNHGDSDIIVKAEYMLFGNAPVVETYDIPSNSRYSVYVNDSVGPGQDVSVKLSGAAEYFVERPMYFSYKQAVEGYGWTGGHCATGARAPRTDWYFAEGTTREGFEEWACIQNPNKAEVRVKVDYVSAGAYTQRKEYTVEPESRISVFVNGDVGPNQDVSMHIHCDSPIVAERPMYFNYHGKWTGGHVIMGTDSPKTKWYFAEGSTREGFEEWLAVQNANDTNAIITCHFLKSDGTQQVEIYTVGANSRWTLDVSQAVGVGVDSAIVIESDQPVVAERPMYFSYKEDTPGYGWTGGHDVVGAKEVKKNWFFAEGCTHDWADEYICVANPGAESAHVTFTFMLESGAPVEHSIDIDPGKRATVKVADIVGRGHDVSTQVTSSKPVVSERPMYFNYNGWTGGHDVVGF